MTRLLHAVAAVAVTVIATLTFGGVPAHAAPGAPCTEQEWTNPAMFSDCANRAGGGVAPRTGCVKAPVPASPTSGLAGWVTTRPDADRRPGVTGRYTGYGVAGYGLDMYDVSCAAELVHPSASAQSAAGSMMFAVASATVGSANMLRGYAYDPGGMWEWSDDFVASATNLIYRYVFTTVGVITLAATGVWLLWRARRGDLSHATKVAGWAILVVVATTGIARWPVESVHAADGAAKWGLDAVHSVLGPAPQHAGKCLELNPDECVDQRSASERASDTMVDTVLYRNWLRAQLGSADSSTARTYGPALYDAATLTWAQAADLDTDPARRQELIDAKGRQWIAVAEQIRAADPQAYEHLRGVHGTDRMAAGFVAMVSAFLVTTFDMVASLVILLGFLFFRVAVILAPLLATVGIMHPAAQWVRWLFNSAVTAAWNIVAFGAVSGLYLALVSMVFTLNALPGLLQLAAAGLMGVACWWLLRPLRRARQIVTGRLSGSRGSGDSDDAAAPRTGRDRIRALQEVSDVVDGVRNRAPADARPRPETSAGKRAARVARVWTEASGFLDEVRRPDGSPLSGAAATRRSRPEATATPSPSRVPRPEAAAAKVTT
jgi:hypothetical protein